MDLVRIYNMTLSSVLPHYINKVERKGQDVNNIYTILSWMTGYNREEINIALEDKINFQQFFENAPSIQSNLHLIKGSICGVKIQEITDDIYYKVRCLDKLIDELAQGKSMDKILRQ